MGKRKTNWVGGGQLVVPETDASTSIGEVVQLVPALPIADFRGQDTACLVEAVYLYFSIKRLLITDFDALGFVMWMSNIQEGGAAPVQSLDALSTTDRAYGNKAIMLMAPLPCPPFLASSDLASAIVSAEIKAAHHEYQAMRKMDRASNVLALAINSDVSLVAQVFVQWRVLLLYGQK